MNTNHSSTFYIKTYGCQMNVYDSELMANLLSSKLQMRQVDSPNEADLLIMNTCSIREKAQEKVFSELGRWKAGFGEKPPVIAVTGCVASQEAEQLVKRAPVVSLVLGPQTIHRLPSLYTTYLETGKKQIDVAFPEVEKFKELPKSKEQPVSAFLSIMEGCNKYCSYCIVPYTRGEEISRTYNDVMQEAKTLAKAGAKEIVFLGQNVNDYDGTMQEADSRANLALLIHSVSCIPGIERIRFTTSHPAAFDNSLIDAYAHKDTKLCNHLHLPVQSGSDRILKAMKRDYNAKQYLDIIAKLKQKSPGITLSTDIIVGFPGETEEDFQETLDLVAKVGFDHSYCFIYSPRPGTPASELVDELPVSVKKERLARLQDALNQSRDRITNNMLNTTVEVLVEDVSKTLTGGVTGRTENNRSIHFQAPPGVVGTIVQVTITHAHAHSMQGRMLLAETENAHAM